MTREEAIERVRRAVERISPSRVEWYVSEIQARVGFYASPGVAVRTIVYEAIGERQRRCRRETGNGSPSVVRSWTQLRNAGAVR
jgi:hypothetical protein